jgi:hypothetical protein
MPTARVIAARALGRPLPPGAEVHHVDGNRQHNQRGSLECGDCACTLERRPSRNPVAAGPGRRRLPAQVHRGSAVTPLTDSIYRAALSQLRAETAARPRYAQTLDAARCWVNRGASASFVVVDEPISRETLAALRQLGKLSAGPKNLAPAPLSPHENP